MTPYEAATVVIGVGQILLIAAGLLFMEAGGRRRARAEEHRHEQMLATLTAQHEQAKDQHEQMLATLTRHHEQVMAQHEQVMANHQETMAALNAPNRGHTSHTPDH